MSKSPLPDNWTIAEAWSQCGEDVYISRIMNAFIDEGAARVQSIQRALDEIGLWLGFTCHVTCCDGVTTVDVMLVEDGSLAQAPDRVCAMLAYLFREAMSETYGEDGESRPAIRLAAWETSAACTVAHEDESKAA